jgi:hypothetical protein
MKKLLVAVLVAAALWSGYWAVGSRAVRAGVAAWFEARRAEGWSAEYSALAVRGFPNRFDTTLTDLALADPASGLAWRAPFFQLLALSYQPHHVIVAWPREQVVATPWETVGVTSERMRGSAVFRPGDGFALDRANVVVDGLALASDAGWTAQAERLLVAVRHAGTGQTRYQVGIEADALAPAPALLAHIDPSQVLPATVERIRLDATVDFDRPWIGAPFEAADEAGLPQPREIRLADFSADWGAVGLRATGEIRVDAAGLPEGRIDVEARNWRAVLELAVSLGAVPEGFAPALESALAALAGLSGSGDTLNVPLVFQDGRISLGPVPLGLAPRFADR